MIVRHPVSVIALLFGLLSFLIGQVTAAKCYYYNESESTDVPCYNDGRVSHCCNKDAICLTNKLCLSLDQPYSLSRGSCTDRSWGPSCPTICENAQLGSGAAVVWYNGTGSDSTYCCNSALINSTSSEMICSAINNIEQDPFPIVDGAVIPGVAGLSSLVKKSDSTSSTVSNDTSVENSTSTSTTAVTYVDNSHKEVAIGAGIGVPLGVIALLAIAWALWERSQRKKTSQMVAQLPQPRQPILSTSDYQNYEIGEISSSPQKPSELDGGLYR